jgi:hypothetical protein
MSLYSSLPALVTHQLGQIMISPCACLGPQCGEQFCPCTMQARGLERSAEWKKQNSPAALAEKDRELTKALSKMFKWKKK